MPVRATKRGAERTRLERDCDVLVCGASFAGLAVARELAGSGARVLVIDRYEIGERQTSACAMPTLWLAAMDLMGSLRQTLRRARRAHARGAPSRWQLPWTFSTFDYRELCALLWDQADDARARVRDGDRHRPQRRHRADRPRRAARAADRRRARLAARALQRDADPAAQRAASRAAWRCTRRAAARRWSCGSTRGYVRAGLRLELPRRRTSCASAIGSFWPTPSRQGADGAARGRPRPARRSGYQGNWIPHQLRRAVEDGVFFAGDSAGHCLPLTAEGIRTALYFGLACGRELRARARRRRAAREQALARYGAFSDSHARKFALAARPSSARSARSRRAAP